MATITLKNIPDELYQKIKITAKRNNRSINGEIISWLKIGLDILDKPSADEVIAKARDFRAKIKVRLTEEEIKNAKETGRL